MGPQKSTRAWLELRFLPAAEQRPMSCSGSTEASGRNLEPSAHSQGPRPAPLSVALLLFPSAQKISVRQEKCKPLSAESAEATGKDLDSHPPVQACRPGLQPGFCLFGPPTASPSCKVLFFDSDLSRLTSGGGRECREGDA